MSLNQLSIPDNGLIQNWNIGCGGLVCSGTITTNILDASTVDVVDLSTNILTLETTSSVPNPPINNVSYFSNVSGILSSTDTLGNTLTYSTTSATGDYIVNLGAGTTGNVLVYADSSGSVAQDSGLASSNLLLADGSVPMTSTLDMNSNPVNNVTFINAINATAIVSNGGTSVTGNVSSFSDGSGKEIQDSGIASSNLLLADGSVPMTNTLDMNSNPVNNVTFINAIDTATIVSNNGPGSTGNIPFYPTAGPIIQNTGIPYTNLFLADGTVSMAGNIDMANVNGLLNVNGITANTFGQVYYGGNGGGPPSRNNYVCMGNLAFINGDDTVAIGHNAQSLAPGDTSVGANSTAGTLSNSSATAIGSSASAIGAQSIAIGDNSTASMAKSIAMGSGATNAVSNSCLIGDSAIVNIRANNDLACDLGTSSNRYNNLYVKSLRVYRGVNSLSGTGAVLVGGTVTVATTAVSTGDIVLLSCTALGGTPGTPSISAINNGVSFVITSSSNTDTSTYSWVIVKSA